MRKPFRTGEESAAREEADEKAEIWFRRGCGCAGEGCLSLVFLPFFSLALVWLVG